MAKNKTTSSPNTCKSDKDCKLDVEKCSIHGSGGGICIPSALDDPNHTADPVNYNCFPTGTPTCNPPPCVLAGTGDCKNLPAGVKPYCYANDEEHPDEIQICAYEKNGFLIPANGCCSKTCPSEECDPKHYPAPPAKPEKDRPKGVPYTKKSKKSKPKDEPFPKLLKIILVIFAILLVAAGIFLSVQ